jgi:hypothetical protein
VIEKVEDAGYLKTNNLHVLWSPKVMPLMVYLYLAVASVTLEYFHSLTRKTSDRRSRSKTTTSAASSGTSSKNGPGQHSTMPFLLGSDACFVTDEY